MLQISTAVGVTGWLLIQNRQWVVNHLVPKLQKQTWMKLTHHPHDQLPLPHRINQMNIAAASWGLFTRQDFQTSEGYFWQQMRSFDIDAINYANSQEDFVGIERDTNLNSKYVRLGGVARGIALAWGLAPPPSATISNQFGMRY